MVKEAPSKATTTKEEISRAISCVASSFQRLVLIPCVPDICSAADHDKSLVNKAVVLKEDPALVYATLPWTHTLTAYQDREYVKRSNSYRDKDRPFFMDKLHRRPPYIYRFVWRARN